MIWQDARRLIIAPLLLLIAFWAAVAAEGPDAPAVPASSAPPCASGCEPNLLIDISAGVLNAAYAQPINRQDAISDYVRRTAISGTSWSSGRQWVELGYGSDYAILDMVAQGCSQSKSVGLRRVSKLYSDGVATYYVRKRILLDGTGYHACPAWTCVAAHPTLVDVETRFHGPLDCLLRQTAFVQARLLTRRNDRVASERGVLQANTRIDREAEPRLAEANRTFARDLEDVRKRRLSLQMLRFASTPSYLQLRAVLADAPDARGWGEPPPINDQLDLIGRVHESAANHAAHATLSGRTVSPEDLAKEGGSFLRPLGVRAVPLENPPLLDDQRLSATLAKEAPLSFTFTDGGLTLTLRVTHFLRGDQNYGGMDITARYRFETVNGVPRAVRHDELEVWPPGHTDKKPLPAIPAAFRSLVQQRFEQLIFLPAFGFEDLNLPDDLRKAGPLTIKQATTTQGWLLLGWNRKDCKPNE